MTVKEFGIGALMAMTAMWGMPTLLVAIGHGWWSIPVVLLGIVLFVMGLWKVFNPVPLFEEIPQESNHD